MLYYLFNYVLRPYFSPLNVCRYITVRPAVAGLSSLMVGLLLGPWLVKRLRALQIGQFIREEGPESHQAKAGTPTMGGLLIVVSIVFATILWADLVNPFVLLALFSTLAFAAIGFADDYSKLARKRNLGLTARGKILFQILTAFGVGTVLMLLNASGVYSTELMMPFLKRVPPDLLIRPLLAHPLLWPVASLPLLIFPALVI